MPVADSPPAWKVWAGSTLVLVIALLATPSEVDNGDICPHPAGGILVHPAPNTPAEGFDLDRYCNEAAPKRGLVAGAVALLGAAVTVGSRRRQQTVSSGSPSGG
ncbi:MAG: hypothetical protein JWM05_3085 [Acidimicrobiales bacterium]|nr:hypothetical protein [Acidimicrobiales bacterium]